MTPKKFALFFFIQLVALTFLKVWFFSNQIFLSSQTQGIVFLGIVAVFSVALVRRFGVIHYLEAVTIIITWAVLDSITDLLLTSNFTSLSIFSNLTYWLGFLVLALAIMFFHKKRHLHIRKELHAKHHGGGHH